jgi:hypothetical protein
LKRFLEETYASAAVEAGRSDRGDACPDRL